MRVRSAVCALGRCEDEALAAAKAVPRGAPIEAPAEELAHVLLEEPGEDLRAARRRYWKNREHVLSKQRQRRRRQTLGLFAGRKVTAGEWADIRRFYDVVRAQGDSCTFKALSVRFKISIWKIQRQSSADGGWSGRVRT